jgi:sarcosine oxidase
VTLTRREALAAAAALTAAGSHRATAAGRSHDVIVIGAGVFGAWTATKLLAAKRRVLLVDAWGPAHSRASSGGESRLTRSGYGPDEIYTRMAWASLEDWSRLSERAGLPIFHKAGVLTFFHREESYATDSLSVHERLRLPILRYPRAELARRWPQIDFSDVAFGLHEANFGALMARRSVQTLVDEFVRAGGEYRQLAVAPPAQGSPLDHVLTVTGERLAAERFVFACGPWLPKLFPDILGNRIFPTRQEIFFFTPPAGDERFGPASLPGWIDIDENIYYGFPNLEGRGFKIANDNHGARADPDTLDRRPSEAGIAAARAYMGRRFPALANALLSEARVCQYENSANGDFLIDWHPRWKNVVLVGGGSGHGFKHGPAVGRAAADLLLGAGKVEPRFSLATKATEQNRAVH